METSESDSQTSTVTTATDGGERKFSYDLITDEIKSLHELALRGSWKTILEKVSAARSFSQLRYPHEHLVYLAFNAVALSKLRRHSEALEDIESSLEDLHSSSYRYESYPNVYPNRIGSMIPFSLRWLQAILPSFLGRRHDSLDLLYLLLHFIRSRIDEAPSNADVWRRRENFVLSTIISQHSNQKEFSVCYSLIKEMITKDVDNLSLISKLGYVQLQFGNLDGAKASFQKVEDLMREKGGKLSTENQNLVGRNKALIYMVGKDYVSAVREYDNVLRGMVQI